MYICSRVFVPSKSMDTLLYSALEHNIDSLRLQAFAYIYRILGLDVFRLVIHIWLINLCRTQHKIIEDASYAMRLLVPHLQLQESYCNSCKEFTFAAKYCDNYAPVYLNSPFIKIYYNKLPKNTAKIFIEIAQGVIKDLYYKRVWSRLTYVDEPVPWARLKYNNREIIFYPDRHNYYERILYPYYKKRYIEEEFVSRKKQRLL